MMPNRKNLPGFANPTGKPRNPLVVGSVMPMKRPLPVVLDPIGRVAVVKPTGTPRNPLVVGSVMPRVRPIVAFGPKKGMKINFA